LKSPPDIAPNIVWILRTCCSEWENDHNQWNRIAIHLPPKARINMAILTREKKRILLVEDHEDAWELVEFSLDEYMLFFARDFRGGLCLARQGYFDLYILDNWLPEGSGVELCRLIRKFDPHTPILFYSAAGYTRDIQEALRAGAQAYLIKPINPDELKQAVALLTSVIDETNFEARQAALAAIREAFPLRHMENSERIENANEKRLRSVEKVIRLKAQMAFLAAGGSRGDFARLWPDVFMEVVRSRRDSV
jgi:DNA-binding response OmpR family regulator